MDSTPALELRHVTKTFGEIAALDDFSLTIGEGELYAVLGENGAGKTTLLKLLAGLHPAGSYRGEMLVAGQPLMLKGPQEAIRHDLGIVMRRWATFDRLSVAENIVIGRWKASGGFLIKPNEIRQQAKEALHMLEIDLDLDAQVGRLSVGQKRLTMLARAICTRPKIVVLDEPAALLTTPEAAGQLLHAIRTLPKHNIACLYMTPRVVEAMGIADRLTVLRDGKSVAVWDRAEFDEVTLTRQMISQQPGRTAAPDDDEESGGLFGSLRSLFTPRR